MPCRAAPRATAAGPRRRRQSCLQTALLLGRARRARARRAFPFVHCASLETRKRLPARLNAAPRRAIAPASHGAALTQSTLEGGAPRLESRCIHALFVPQWLREGWHVLAHRRTSTGLGGCHSVAVCSRCAGLRAPDNPAGVAHLSLGRARVEFAALRHRCDEIIHTSCVSQSCCWHSCSQLQRWS